MTRKISRRIFIGGCVAAAIPLRAGLKFHDGEPVRARDVVASLRRWKAKASTVGLDWNDPLAVLVKSREETDEIEQALRARQRDRVATEVGA